LDSGVHLRRIHYVLLSTTLQAADGKEHVGDAQLELLPHRVHAVQRCHDLVTAPEYVGIGAGAANNNHHKKNGSTLAVHDHRSRARVWDSFR